MKNILIIAYSYPPVGSGRSLRALKFSKYLPRFDWNPFIITPRRHVVPDFDYDLSGKIRADIKVFRTFNMEPRFIKGSNKCSFKKSHILRSAPLIRFFKFLYKNIFIPDIRIIWLPFAVWKSLFVIKKEKIGVIMVIAEPFSSLLAGVILKFFTGLPLVSDFRDEWTAISGYRDKYKTRVVKRIEWAMEKIVIRASNIVTVTTCEIRDNFKRRYPRYQNKFHTIENGFDQDDYKGNMVGKGDKFTITYAGTLYENRFPRAFFRGFAELADEVPAIVSSTRILIAGNMDEYSLGFFRTYKYCENLTVAGQVSFKQTIKYLKSSDLLFFQSESDEAVSDRYIPAKLYEYIGAKRPIIALSNSGIIKKILKDSGLGAVFDTSDYVSIKNILREFIINRKDIKNSFNLKLDEFTRESATRKLSLLLNSL